MVLEKTDPYDGLKLFSRVVESGIRSWLDMLFGWDTEIKDYQVNDPVICRTELLGVFAVQLNTTITWKFLDKTSTDIDLVIRVHDNGRVLGVEWLNMVEYGGHRMELLAEFMEEELSRTIYED